MLEKLTKTDLEIDKNLTLDACCEVDCGISIMVDKIEKESARKSRCIACMMRLKMGAKR